MKRQAPLLRIGIKAPGRHKIGKASAAVGPSGLQRHGTEKRISGNVTNGELYEISNMLEATLLSLLQGTIFVYM